MSKQTERLKRQLVEFAEVINLFASEAVQVKVIERLLDSVIDGDRQDNEVIEPALRRARMKKNFEGRGITSGPRKPGATKILNRIITNTDFFDKQRSIAAITDHCRDQYDSNFKTSELSGILLKMANEGKLARNRASNNRFEYIKA